MSVFVEAQKPMHETHRIAVAGAVDADGHILEPPDLWENYIDPKYRDRALRIVVDEHGLEELELGGQRSTMSRAASHRRSAPWVYPDLAELQRDPERTYLREAPYGSMDAGERLQLLDAENIDIAILYTTVGLLWEAEIKEPELSQAYTRAYNRWICEFAAGEPRLVPTAHISLSDPTAAAAENCAAPSARERRACMSARSPTTPSRSVTPTTTSSSPLRRTSTSHSPFTRPSSRSGPRATRMGDWQNVKQLRLLASVTASDGVRHQFTTLFDYGVFDKFPKLKVLVLESGGGWIGYWLDRIDAVYGHTFIGNKVPLKHKPSDYFRAQIWISCDPDERMIPALAERFGVDRFMWASDFPHADHTPDYVHDLNSSSRCSRPPIRPRSSATTLANCSTCRLDALEWVNVSRYRGAVKANRARGRAAGAVTRSHRGSTRPSRSCCAARSRSRPTSRSCRLPTTVGCSCRPISHRSPCSKRPIGSPTTC